MEPAEPVGKADKVPWTALVPWGCCSSTPQPGARRQQELVSHHSGGWEPEIGALVWSGLQAMDFVIYLHGETAREPPAVSLI